MSSRPAHGRLWPGRPPTPAAAGLGRGSTTGGVRACGARGLPVPVRACLSEHRAQDAGTVSSNVVPAERYAVTFAATCAGVSAWSLTCST